MRHERQTDRKTLDSDGASRDGTSAELRDALEAAEQFRCLLDKEAETLRRFKGRELMEITYQKESLFRDLVEKVKTLKAAKDRTGSSKEDPRYDSLRASLRDIERRNRSNRVFIEGALAHYRDFVQCLCPAGYGPRHAGEQRRELASFKGLTFRKEI